MTKNDKMIAYKANVVQLIKKFNKVTIVNILWEENSVVDAPVVEASKIHSSLKEKFE